MVSCPSTSADLLNITRIQLLLLGVVIMLILNWIDTGCGFCIYCICHFNSIVAVRIWWSEFTKHAWIRGMLWLCKTADVASSWILVNLTMDFLLIGKTLAPKLLVSFYIMIALHQSLSLLLWKWLNGKAVLKIISFCMLFKGVTESVAGNVLWKKAAMFKRDLHLI